MPPSKFQKELERIGHTMNRWKAELRFVMFAAGVIAALCAFSFSDIYVQYQRLGRIGIWLILVALVVVAFKYMGKCYIEKHTTMGMAAVVELAFPELDNHLINFLQFSQSNDGDPFKKAYLSRGVPEWSKVNVGRMKNRKIHRRAKLVLALTVAMLIAPFFFNGQAWGVAIWRIINPFSNVQPISLTKIISVEPGDGSAILGESLVLKCYVVGKKGHEVHLDIKPSDDDRTTYALGSVNAVNPTNSFKYTIKSLTTDLKYRFRAGDSPSPEWYKIKARTPLALSAVEIRVSPPGYTQAKQEKYDGLSDDVVILQGSEVELSIKCNSDLKTATVMVQDQEPISMLKSGSGKSWRGAVRVDAGGALKVVASDVFGDELESKIKYTLVVDDPPTIEVISPKGKTMLPPSSDPLIEFAVVDDYGLKLITVERLARDDAGKATGTVLEKWELSNARDFSELWHHKLGGAAVGRELLYRVTARDNNPYKDQTANSQTIAFSSVDAKTAGAVENKLRDKASDTLGKIVNLQRENIDQTKRYQMNMDIVPADQWKALAERQTEIKTITKELLGNPTKPLGTLTESVQKCYINEMPDAIRLLDKASSESNAEKVKTVFTALQQEEKILRTLMYASSTAAQVQAQQKVSMLTAMLSNLINGQIEVIKKTKACYPSTINVTGSLVNSQEDLGGDVAEFIAACGREADTLGADQQQSIDTLRVVAKLCAEKNIKADMMIATDRLAGNKPQDATPSQESALAKLKEVQAEFESIKAAVADERLELMQDVMQDMGAKISAAKELSKLAAESMDVVDPNANKNDKEVDMMEEADLAELNKNLKESMLDIPIDLQIFMELNAANDMVEDVVAVFMEVEEPDPAAAAAGLEALTEAKESAFVKDLAIAEAMQEVEGAMEELESWLGNKPNDKAIIQEALDQEEMPPEGMALGALKTEVQDILSDLLEQSQDPDDLEQAEDSPTNNAVPDMEPGGPVTPGETASFGAKGKTGNEAPEHKEQDGRSNVGRQGMSNGECAAGSGTIQEGDPNMDERRTDDPTQSGQVDVDGDADTKATGGGKQGTGKGDDYGMGGGGDRMDSTTAGSREGLEALLSKTENTYTKANMNGVKSMGLKDAAHHIRQALDAFDNKRPINEIEELRQKAIGELKRADTELSAGTALALDTGSKATELEDVIDTGSDEAPEKYRDLVSEYYKKLSEEM